MKKAHKIAVLSLFTLTFFSCAKDKQADPQPTTTTITSPPQIKDATGYLYSFDWINAGSGLYYQVKPLTSVNQLVSLHIELDFQDPFFPVPVQLNGIEYSYSWNQATKEIMFTAKDLTSPYSPPSVTVNYLLNYY